MKKIICLLMAMLLVFGLVACGGNDTEGDTKPNNGKTPTTQTGTSGTEPNKDTKPTQPAINDVEVEVDNDVYVKYPSDWRLEDVYRGVVMYRDDARLVNVTYKKASSFDGALEDIVSYLSEAFVEGSYGYSQGSIYGHDIVPSTVERSTVAGYDCVKFEGIINNDRWDCHVYGYGLIVEDLVIMITGLVSAKDQDADMIAEIDALTDRIAASIEVKN